MWARSVLQVNQFATGFAPTLSEPVTLLIFQDISLKTLYISLFQPTTNKKYDVINILKFSQKLVPKPSEKKIWKEYFQERTSAESNICHSTSNFRPKQQSVFFSCYDWLVPVSFCQYFLLNLRTFARYVEQTETNHLLKHSQ